MESAETASGRLLARKFRSRKARPCDLCRRRKARCFIQDGDPSCALCRNEQVCCTFEAGPAIKKKRLENGESDTVAPLLPGADSPTATYSDSQSDHSMNGAQALEALLSAIAHKSSSSARSPPCQKRPSIVYGEDADEQTESMTKIRESDEHPLTGAVEHVGGTGLYFEELDQVGAMPARFVRVSSTSPSSHRIESSSDRVLSPSDTVLSDVVSVVGTHADVLLDVYFRIVHPVFPVCALDDLSRSVGRIASRNSSAMERGAKESEDKALAPLVACILVLASNFAWTNPKLANSRALDVGCLRDYVRLACVIEARMPRLATVQALILQFTLLAFRSPAKSQELWSSMGLLLTTAQNLGLHQDPTSWTIPRAEVAMRKRLWWFIVVTTTFLALSLGKPNLIHPDLYDVPALSADDFHDGSDGDILMRSCKLTGLVQRITGSFYTTRAVGELLKDPTSIKSMMPPLFTELEQWYRDLNSSPRKATRESTSLHLVYYVVRITLHRTVMKYKRICDTADRTEALCTMSDVANWAKSLTAHQIASIWPTHSKYDFAIISSFMLALLFTSATEEEFYAAQEIVHTWRWTLEYHARSCAELLEDGLQRINSFCKEGSDSLFDMWRRRKNLAIYHYGVSRQASPHHTPRHTPRPTPDSAIAEVFPLFPLSEEINVEHWVADGGSNDISGGALWSSEATTSLPASQADHDSENSGQLDAFFWNSSSESLRFPYDFWSAGGPLQIPDFQFGLVPD